MDRETLTYNICAKCSGRGLLNKPYLSAPTEICRQCCGTGVVVNKSAARDPAQETNQTIPRQPQTELSEADIQVIRDRVGWDRDWESAFNAVRDSHERLRARVAALTEEYERLKREVICSAT